MADEGMLEAVREFADRIKRTEVYREYILQREKLKKIPELYEKVNDYRQKNFDMQNSGQSEDLFEHMDEFEREFERFRENPLVDDFLSAELAFCRMIQKLNVMITEELDFE